MVFTFLLTEFRENVQIGPIWLFFDILRVCFFGVMAVITKIVATTQATAMIGSNQVELKNLGKLAAGVYVIKVKTSAKTLNQKLIK